MFKFEIVDNFLNNEDFSELCSVKLKNIKNTEIAIYHNIIYKNGHTVVDCLSEKSNKFATIIAISPPSPLLVNPPL